jgi:hypothetical protein
MNGLNFFIFQKSKGFLPKVQFKSRSSIGSNWIWLLDYKYVYMDYYDFTTTVGLCIKGWRGSMDFKNTNKSTIELRRLFKLVKWSLYASNIELQTLQCPLLWQLYTCVMSKPNPKQGYLPLTHYEFNEIQDKMHYYKLHLINDYDFT